VSAFGLVVSAFGVVVSAFGVVVSAFGVVVLPSSGTGVVVAGVVVAGVVVVFGWSGVVAGVVDELLVSSNKSLPTATDAVVVVIIIVAINANEIKLILKGAPIV